MHTLFIWLLSCKGCGSCWYMPVVPSVSVTDPPPFDTAIDEPPEDTGEEELPPSSLCDFEELEPNNDPDDPQDLPLERWMCGAFDVPMDGDVFGFEVDSDAWIRVWVRASALGSMANPRLFIFDEDDEFTGSFEDSFLSEDIDRTFKLDEARTMGIGLFEQNIGTVQFGEDYFWRMRVSITKAPVKWDLEEEEPNDSKDDAMSVANGDRIYGWVENGTKNDWFSLDVTEANTDVVVETDSWVHGSPLNPEIEVKGPDLEQIAIEDRHDTSSNFDAKVAFTADVPGEYLIRLGACCEANPSSRKGGMPFWYVLDVSTSPGSPVEEDTASGE
jgi:hypothetical protein